MTRLTLLLPLTALALCSCDTPYVALFPEKAAKNRIVNPGDPRGDLRSARDDEAYLASIPPSPISTDRGGTEIPNTPEITSAPKHDPNRKITLEELTEASPSQPLSPSSPRPAASSDPDAEEVRELEPQPYYWFGRPNPGNTAAIPIGPIKKP